MFRRRAPVWSAASIPVRDLRTMYWGVKEPAAPAHGLAELQARNPQYVPWVAVAPDGYRAPTVEDLATIWK